MIVLLKLKYLAYLFLHCKNCPMLSTYPPFVLNAFDTTGPSITVCVLSNLLATDRFISKLYCTYYVYKFVVNRNDNNGSHAR